MSRGGSRFTATSKMELFVIIVNNFQPLTIITKSSVLDVATVLEPPPMKTSKNESFRYFQWINKETNGTEWVNTPLYESKATFVSVSVDQALISNEKDVKSLKLSDFCVAEFPSL